MIRPADSRQFLRMAHAIEYLYDHFDTQPDLASAAAAVHMSAHHFQRTFAEWVGISPKKFVQYLSVERAKTLLAGQATLLEAADAAGLSGTGRLHDLFVHIEGMTPGEYKQGGAALTICHAIAPSPFGEVLVAATGKGVCYLAFADDPAQALIELAQRFPRATLLPAPHRWLEPVRILLQHSFTQSPRAPIALHLKGTPFQLQVWQALLRIAPGRLDTYGALAARIGHPGASRAVGTAVGDNPVSWLIPCHRVIRSNGVIGHYHWQRCRKLALLGWEALQADTAN